MSNMLVLVVPFILATESIMLLPSTLGSPPIVPAEKEYKFLTAVTLCLLGLLVGLGLMVRFPDLGAVIAEYNQF
jgi:hypothetical protein